MGGAAEHAARADAGAAEADALSALRLDWGSAWAVGCGNDRWQAARRDGTGHVLTRASAAGLDLALRAGYGRPR